MKNLALRIGLLLLAAGALAAAGVETWQVEREKARLAEATRQIEDRLRGLMLVVTDMRAHQQAYVATGQGTGFWAAKVSQVLNIFDKEVAALRPLLRSADAQTAIDSAASTVETFRKMDARAREYALNGQEQLASDLIFTDGFETTASTLSQVDAARSAEVIRADADAAVLLGRQLEWLSGGGAACLLMLLLLTPRGRSIEQHDIPAPAPLPAPKPLPEAEDAIVRRATPRTELTPDLMLAADVCAGMARVLETAELTELLGRLAQVLNAAGLIIWVADRSGAELRPVLAHGYSNQTLARMGTIARDGHNAVAAAYRTGATRTVSGDQRTNGAIVAPIVSPGGCLGVLAAEVRRGAENSTAMKALAMVFASQLGTLVSSVPSEAPAVAASS